METFASKVYKTPEGRHILQNMYRHGLAAISPYVSERMVETGFGNTHVVLYGNPRGVPVMAFYGMNAINPLILSPFIHGLDMERLLLIAPDPIGTVGFSSENQRRMSAYDYASWAIQILDALDLPDIAVMGYSFGGKMALQICAMSVLRIKRLLLVDPTGILPLSAVRMSKFMHSEQDEMTAMEQALAVHANSIREDVKPVRLDRVRKLNAPVYVVAGDSDSLYPGRKIIQQSKKIFPHTGGLCILPQNVHDDLINDKHTDELAEYFSLMSTFLAG